MNKWDMRFLRVAAREVARWSKDPDKKVGCLVVSPDRRRWTAGYNGFPVGVGDTQRRLDDKELKNRLAVHAELNAILNARTDLSGWTMYVTTAPCVECTKAIIQAGLTRVVRPSINGDSDWALGQRRAAELLREAGVAATVVYREEYKNAVQD